MAARRGDRPGQAVHRRGSWADRSRDRGDRGEARELGIGEDQRSHIGGAPAGVRCAPSTEISAPSGVNSGQATPPQIGVWLSTSISAGSCGASARRPPSGSRRRRIRSAARSGRGSCRRRIGRLSMPKSLRPMTRTVWSGRKCEILERGRQPLGRPVTPAWRRRPPRRPARRGPEILAAAAPWRTSADLSGSMRRA